MSSATPDSALLDDALGGDRAAFGLLIERHYDALLGACRRMLRDPELARDAAQEAVIRAMLGLDGLRDADRFAAWLVGIGLNVSRSLLASQHRQRAIEISTDVDGLAGERDGRPFADPAVAAQTRELGAHVRKAIAALPAGQRQAVALFYLAGLTHAEIADEIGTAPGAIKTRLHKARRGLQKSLAATTYGQEHLMTTEVPDYVPMHITELRRTAAEDPLDAHHIIYLTDAEERQLRIWIGPMEATALALILEQVQMPRPGAYQFTAGLLNAAGATVAEVRITELTDSTYYAQTILDNGTAVDSRPSDAITLALVTDAPIHVAETVLTSAQQSIDSHRALHDQADQATDNASAIADEVRQRYANATQARKPARD